MSAGLRLLTYQAYAKTNKTKEVATVDPATFSARHVGLNASRASGVLSILVHNSILTEASTDPLRTLVSKREGARGGLRPTPADASFGLAAGGLTHVVGVREATHV